MSRIPHARTPTGFESEGSTGRQPGPIRPGALAATWRRWTAVVELFARRRPARRRLDPRSYDALYRELTGICRTLADSADEAGRAHYDRLEDIVRPWLTPRTLAQADHAVLFDLLIKCREVERVLRGRTWTGAANRWVAPVFLSILLGSVYLALIWIACGNWSPLWYRVQGWSDVAWIAVKRASDVQWLIFCGVVVVPASILILSRAARG